MKRLAIILIIIVIGNTFFSQAQTFDSLLTQDKNFSGVVLLAQDGKIKGLKAIGKANREKQTAMTVDSKFKIASMSKVFTALMVMKLVDEKKIELTKTIAAYYPAYKGEGRDNVTIHDLLTYSSGIENKIEPLGMQAYKTKLPLDQFIDQYCSGKLVDTPGKKSVYGNTEYIILHKIIEQASGMGYKAFLKKTILDPLKLRNTGVCRSNRNISGLVNAYVYNDSLKTFTVDEPYLPEMFFGSGFLYSTAKDLLTLDQAIFNGRLLSKKAMEQLLTIHEDLGYTAYGFWGSAGWGNFKERFYYRTGGILGSTSNWIHTMDTKKTILVLSNNDASNLYELSEKIYLLK